MLGLFDQALKEVAKYSIAPSIFLPQVANHTDDLDDMTWRILLAHVMHRF
jgi:hypothetical protein